MTCIETKKKSKQKSNLKLSEWKYINFFDLIQIFLLCLFVEEKYDYESLQKMDQNQKDFICLYLTAVIGVKVQFNDLVKFKSIEQFLHFYKNRKGFKIKKRNEEKFKIVYKIFIKDQLKKYDEINKSCLLYTSPSPRD